MARFLRTCVCFLLQLHNAYFQVGIYRVNFTKHSVIHNPSGLKIKVNFLNTVDVWTIDQNYSTKSAKIRNNSGFSQQLSGLFLAEGVHLPKFGSSVVKPTAVPLAPRVAPLADAGARSNPNERLGLEHNSTTENDVAVHRSSGQKQQQGSSDKQELMKCSDGHFRLLPKKSQSSKPAKSVPASNAAAANGQVLFCTPQRQNYQKSRNVDDADSAHHSSHPPDLNMSATKQTPPRRRLFRSDSAPSEAELPCTQPAGNKRFKTDCAKSRRNTDASTRQGRSASPDNSAFAGAHPKYKPRRSTLSPVAAPIDNYSFSSGDEFDEQAEEGYLAVVITLVTYLYVNRRSCKFSLPQTTFFFKMICA